MDDEKPTKDEVRQELDELKEVAKGYTIEQVRSGEWFATFLRHALGRYAKKVNAQYFRDRYPHLPADAVIDRRVQLAKRYATIEGGLSAGAYSAAVAATIGSGGGASPLTVPAAALSFTADLLYTTKLQLNLAYDISVLYGHPVDMDDPEDLYDMVKVAFGVKAGEALRAAAGKAAPEAVRQGVKAVVRGGALAWLKALPVVGKYLLQRNIIKFAIPVVAVPLAMGLNYWSTGSIARLARQVYRDKAAIKEKSLGLASAGADELLLLKAMWLVIAADKQTAAEESWLLNDLTKALEREVSGAEAAAEFEKIVDLDPEALLSELSRLDADRAARIYDAACYAAAVDHEIQKEEQVVLRQLAEACRQPYDEKAIKAMARVGLV